LKRLIIATIVIGLAFAAFPLVAAAAPEDKVFVCHATSSESNPWVIIQIAESAWYEAHDFHHDDADFVLKDITDRSQLKDVDPLTECGSPPSGGGDDTGDEGLDGWVYDPNTGEWFEECTEGCG
jgi:hypothetical protein